MTQEPTGIPSGLRRARLTALREILTSRFAQDELHTLCFELDVDYENIPGEIKSSKARELLSYLDLRERIPDLVTVGRRLRPDIPWDDALQLDLASSEERVAEVYIPAGPFLMGSPPGEGISAYETPLHTVDLPAYRIGKYPVTNEQYTEFIRHTGRIAPPQLGWEGQAPRPEECKHPVAGVTWYEALAYCKWLTECLGRRYSLPSEAQWEKAARGTEGQLFPWGNEWDPSRCNSTYGLITPVDAYPEGASPYGCHDMVGNVREWTSSLWGESRRNPQFRYPWASDRREELAASKYVLRVYRGGAMAGGAKKLRCSRRGAQPPDHPGPPNARHGFRIVLSMA